MMNLMKNYQLNKCNILNFVDNNLAKQDKYLLGKIIKAHKKEELDGKNILICSMIYANDIKRQINDMNINCKIETL